MMFISIGAVTLQMVVISHLLWRGRTSRSLVFVLAPCRLAYIPPFLHIFLLGFLAHSLDILLTVKMNRRLQNNRRLWKKLRSTCNILTEPKPLPQSSTTRTTRSTCRDTNPMFVFSLFAEIFQNGGMNLLHPWNTGSPFSHALLYKTHYNHEVKKTGKKGLFLVRLPAPFHHLNLVQIHFHETDCQTTKQVTLSFFF